VKSDKLAATPSGGALRETTPQIVIQPGTSTLDLTVTAMSVFNIRQPPPYRLHGLPAVL
jgi:hypothetical protein